MASLSSILFSPEIQSELDRFYVNVISQRFPSPSSKLAFASAACQRLYGDHSQQVQNPSLSYPFMLAMFTNVELDLKEYSPGKGALTEEKRTIKLKEMRSRQQSNQQSKPAQESFKDIVAQAQLAMISNGDALALEQKVATCQAVELEVMKTVKKPVQDQKITSQNLEIAKAVCGQLIVDEESVHQNFAVPLKGPTRGAVEAAVKGVTPSVSPPSTTQETLPNPSPPIGESEDAELRVFAGICERIEKLIMGARCYADNKKSKIELGSFSPAMADRDKGMEHDLVIVAEVLLAENRNLIVDVSAYASSAPIRCSGMLSGLRRKICNQSTKENMDPNTIISFYRSHWAASIIRRRGGNSLVVNCKGQGADEALDNNSRLDRRSTIEIRIPESYMDASCEKQQ